MANTQSTQVAGKYPVSGPGIGGRNLHTMIGEVTLAAGAANDTMEFFYLHRNFRVVGAKLKASDLDTNGSPTITISVGDADDDDRFFAASTVGQGGTVADMTLATGVGYKTSKKTLVTGKLPAGAATFAAGTVTLIMFGYIEEPE